MKRADRIQELLKSLEPLHIELVNESDDHSGPPGRETHFKLLIVSSQFENLSRVDRQRVIYQKLNSELQSGLHALSLRALTAQEWSLQNNKERDLFQSPECVKK
jgi:stress-induced morphogen